MILKILLREANCKRWRRVNYSTWKPRGQSDMSAKVPNDTTDTEDFDEFHTKKEVFEQVSKHLSERFRLAFSTPYHSGQLFDNIGFVGDTDCARQILEGSYVFPSDTNPAMKLILEEVVITYQELSKEEVATYVSVDNFQHYWQTVYEHTSSSYIGLHFGHYKAASFDRDLSALHAATLTACVKKGVPLARWEWGLTVLLEKIMGNNYVHKLHAIVFLKRISIGE